MTPCPCCGRGMDNVPPAPSLTHLRMRPMERKLLTALLDVYPRPLPINLAIDKLYSDDPNGGPIDALGCLRAFKHRLRKVLKPYGWTLPSGYRDYGQIRLERVDRASS